MAAEGDRDQPEPAPEAGDDRHDVVAELLEAVARGDYAVEPIEVADAILRFHVRAVPS